MKNQANGSVQGVGLGLRSAYFSYLHSHKPVPWYVIQIEDYFNASGYNHHVLVQIRQDAAITFHGVSMSI